MTSKRDEVTRIERPALARVDRAGRYAEVSARFAAQLARNTDELVGAPWEEALAPEYRDTGRAARACTIEQGAASLVAQLATRQTATLVLVRVPGGAEQVQVILLGCAGGAAGAEQLRTRLRNLQLVHEVSTDVSRSQRLEDIYERALDAVLEACRADRAALLLFDDDGVIRPKAARGLSDAYQEAIEGHSPWCPDDADAAPITVQDVLHDTDLVPLRRVLEAEGIRSMVFVPLPAGERLLGKFMVYYDRPHTFLDEEVQLAATVANHVAFAIERRAAAAELEESERRFRLVAESAPSIVWSATPDGQLDYVNARALDFVDRPLDELTGAGWLSVVHPEDVERTQRKWEHAVRSGEEYEIEYRLRRADGAYVWHLVHGVPLRDEHGRILHWYGTGLDIEAERRTREALERHTRELEEGDRRKDEFLAVLGHELRNPLAAIGNAARVLGIVKDPERAAWARRVVETHVRQLSAMLDDLLDLSRVARGTIGLDRRRTTLAEVVARAVETAHAQIAARRHELVVDVPADLELLADPVRLTQVVVNLLTNAARYTPEGGRIEVRAGQEDDWAVLRVRDDGAGIPADQLERIFEPFTQIRPSSYGRGGLGIGLSLVKRLVELHGGTVSARSAGECRGSEFSVKLPRVSSVRLNAHPAAPAESGRLTGMHVLLVEDEPDIAEGLAAILEHEGGCHVEVASAGEAALSALAEHLPDAAVVDLGLPDMTGFDLARRIRASPRGRDLLLIALTGFGHPEARRESRAAGFQHHLTKPADLSELLALLQPARPSAGPSSE